MTRNPIRMILTPARPIRGAFLVFLTLGSLLWGSVMLFSVPSTFKQDKIAALPQVADNEAPEVTPLLDTQGAYAYDGTWTFDADVPGELPAGWYIDNTWNGGTVTVAGSKAGHYGVLQVDDTEENFIAAYHQITPRTAGFIEYYLYGEENYNCGLLGGYSGTTAAFWLHKAGGTWYANDVNTGVPATAHEWHHLRIDFGASGATRWVTFTVDGAIIAQNKPWKNGVESIDRIYVNSGTSGIGGKAYFDAIGLSWEGYAAGTNLEGLAVKDAVLEHRATWTFDTDIPGALPAGWTRVSDLTQGTVMVVGSRVGHYGVLQVDDTKDDSGVSAYRDIGASPTAGIIEYYLYLEDNVNCGWLSSRSGTTAAFYLHRAAGTWWANDFDTGCSATTNTWHHVRIDFGASGITFTVDGTTIASRSWMNGMTSINRIYVGSGCSALGGKAYFDAIGFSWAAGYDAGDNMLADDMQYLVEYKSPWTFSDDPAWCWTFNTDVTGYLPLNWVLETDPSEGIVYVNENHNLVVNDISPNSGVRAHRALLAPMGTGRVEYDVLLMEDGINCALLGGYSGTTPAFYLHRAAGTWWANDANTGYSATNAWHHVRIDFGAGGITFAVDGATIASRSWMNGRTSINRIAVASGCSAIGGHVLFDNIGILGAASTPAGWVVSTPDQGAIGVAEDYAGKSQVLVLDDNNTSIMRAWRPLSQNASTGAVEYDVYLLDNINCGLLGGHFFDISSGTSTTAFTLHRAAGTWWANDADTGISATTNTWHHVRINFGAGGVTFAVDGSYIASRSWMYGMTSINRIVVDSGASVACGRAYYDDIIPFHDTYLTQDLLPSDFRWLLEFVDVNPSGSISWLIVDDDSTGGAFNLYANPANPSAPQPSERVLATTWVAGEKITVDASTLSAGTYCIVAQAWDQDNSQATLNQVNIFKDALPMSTCPVDFSYIANAQTPTLQWTIFDADITPAFGGTWEVRHDGAYYSSGAFTNNNQVVSITCGEDSSGVHIYEVYVDDGLAGLRLLDIVQVTARHKYAVIWGISIYPYVPNLEYCDNDALDVYNYLISSEFEVMVFYGGYPDAYSFAEIPTEDKIGYATESNVRAAIQDLASQMQAGDQLVIWASSHGGATGIYDGGWQSKVILYEGNDPWFGGFSYLLMYDYSAKPSTEYDTTDEAYAAGEIRSDLSTFNDGVEIFIGIDACQSGGFIFEFESRNPLPNQVFIITTCGVAGYGYDNPTYENGELTYWFVERGLVSEGISNAESAALYAENNYNPSNSIDNIRHWDSDTGNLWYF